jgi:serine/threonine-protein kinase
MSERLTRRGTVLGSAYYMSPEQAQASDSVDQRSDLYGVGAMLFEMLAGAAALRAHARERRSSPSARRTRRASRTIAPTLRPRS